MSEITIASYTAIIGASLLVISQILQRFLIEPIQEYRKLRGDIAYTLIMYAVVPVMENDPDFRGIAHKHKEHLRSLASNLRRHIEIIPFYGLFSILGIVDSKKRVIKASQSLVGWSNSVRRNSEKHRDSVADVLGIDWRGKID
ncbi:MAG: hypothetical protein AAF846_12610 [Chloroflexota bacterium]